MLLTVDEFIARIGIREAEQIAGTGPRDARQLDRDRIAAEIATAADVIAGYVVARYPQAIDHPNDMLRGWCTDIARWRLRGQGGPESTMADTVKDRYEEAMKGLRDIAAGRMSLDLPAGAPGADAAEAANAGANTRIHSAMPPSRLGSVLEGW